DRDSRGSIENSVTAQQVQPGVTVFSCLAQAKLQFVVNCWRLHRVAPLRPIIDGLGRKPWDWMPIEEEVHLLQPSVHRFLKSLFALVIDIFQRLFALLGWKISS